MKDNELAESRAESRAENWQKLGEVLSARREELGYSLESVAQKLRLTTTHINELETGDFSLIKNTIFARGYVKNYAVLLAIPVDDLLQKVATENITGEYEPLVVPSRTIELPSGWQKMLLIGFAVVLLIGILAYSLLNSGDAQPEVANSNELNETPVISAAEVSENSIDQSTKPNEAPLDQVVSSETRSAATPDAEQLPPVDNRLSLTFSGECWIEVRDQTSRLLIADLKRAGDSLELDGQPPYRIVIGNSENVEISFHGEPVTITPDNDNNSAKITVGE